MPKVAFPLTSFTDAEGNPLSNGYLLIRINTDVQTPGPGQIGAQSISRVQLDSNGVISGSPTFWGNAALNPPNTVYLLRSFTKNGQEVLSNLPVIVTGGVVGNGFGSAFGSSFAS